MRLIPLILLFLCSTAWAGEKELQLAQELASKKGIELSAKDVSDLQTKGWRNRREGEFKPLVSSVARPSDYENDYHRGTVEYDPKWKNYSYQKVKIQNGNTIKESNFTQIYPATDVFDRSAGFGHDLTFEGCNLVNVKTYDDWTIKDSNTAQIYREITTDGNGVETVESTYLAKSSKDISAEPLEPAGVQK